MTRTLSNDEREALSGRIREAESRTSGEIYCVVARSSDSYFYPAAFMLTIGVVLAGIPVALWLDRTWLALPHLMVALSQAAALATALLVLWVAPGLRILLVPRRLRYRRAHDNAVRQFLAHNVHVTTQRTGVLIFVSLAERYAEIVADAGIDDKVSQADWDGIVGGIIEHAASERLADGLGEAIDRAGLLLSAHFPGGLDNPNELEDHVVEI